MEFPNKVIDLCNILDELRAENIILCDGDKLHNGVDYFILATAKDLEHIKVVAENFIEKYASNNYGELSREGYNLTKWVSFDCDEAIVNIFTQDERQKYNIDKLLSDGKNMYTFASIKKQLHKEFLVSKAKEEKQKKKDELTAKRKERLDKKQQDKDNKKQKKDKLDLDKKIKKDLEKLVKDKKASKTENTSSQLKQENSKETTKKILKAKNVKADSKQSASPQNKNKSVKDSKGNSKK